MKVGLILVVAVVSSFAACSGSDGEGRVADDESQALDAVRPASPDDLRLSVMVEGTLPVTFRLFVGNVADDPVELGMSSTPIYFEVRTLEGEAVVAPGEFDAFLGDLRIVVLRPGQAEVFSREWDGTATDPPSLVSGGTPVPPGTYLVQGFLTNRDPPEFFSDPVEFELASTGEQR